MKNSTDKVLLNIYIYIHKVQSWQCHQQQSKQSISSLLWLHHQFINSLWLSIINSLRLSIIYLPWLSIIHLPWLNSNSYSEPPSLTHSDCTSWTDSDFINNCTLWTDSGFINNLLHLSIINLPWLPSLTYSNSPSSTPIVHINNLPCLYTIHSLLWSLHHQLAVTPHHWFTLTVHHELVLTLDQLLTLTLHWRLSQTLLHQLPTTGCCRYRNWGSICWDCRGQRFSLQNLEEVRILACMLHLLPQISSFLKSTVLVHAPSYFPKPLLSLSCICHDECRFLCGPAE